MTSSGLTFELRYFLNVQYIQIRNTGHAYVQISGLVFFFWVYRPAREFFTHMETSPLSVKGCKF